MNIIEQWKPVEGFEGLYEVSNLGRVKSLNYNRTGVEKILKPGKDGWGYLKVVLCRDGKRKYLKVHRLVAAAFIPNPEKLPEINHLDENKANNCVENLEWSSRWDNMHFGTLYERSSVSQRNHPAKSKPVEASKYSDFRTIELHFTSIAEAGRNGYDQSPVAACCRGCYSIHRRNFYKGLFWRFAS